MITFKIKVEATWESSEKDKNTHILKYKFMD